MFWKLYWSRPKKERKEFLRWHFWAWMMENMPSVYWWLDEHLPWDTLPF